MENLENLRKIQEFCQNDVKIKECLSLLAPDRRFLGNEDYNSEYSDKLFDGLKDIRYYLEKTLSDFNLTSYKEHLDALFDSYELKLAEAGTNSRSLDDFYKNNLSDMDPLLIKKTGETCVGYTLRGSEIYNLVLETKTINEFLHVIHSQLMNDEHIYGNLPEVNKAMSQEDYPCTLYGVDSQISEVILNSVSAVKDIGWTDIMSLSEDKVIMMIRDKGHALTIQIDRNEEDSFNVKYYIPKLCNIKMINNLRGVSSVDESSKYAVGTFDSKKEELGLDLLHFVTNVPTDENMSWGGEDRTEYSDFFKIFENMDISHLEKVAEFNPILHQVDGFDDYFKNRCENEKTKDMSDEGISF